MGENYDQYSLDGGDYEDGNMPPIYTSDDETQPVFSRPTAPIAEAVAAAATVVDPVKDTSLTSDSPTRDPNPTPTKKLRLAVSSSLVSYTIDEDDDDVNDDSTEITDNQIMVEEDSGSSSPPNQLRFDPSQSNLVRYGLNPESMLEGSDELLDMNHNQPTILGGYDQHKPWTRTEPIHVPSETQLLQLHQEQLQAQQAFQANPERAKPNDTAPVDEDALNSDQPTDDVTLPAEPSGHCSMKLQEKVDREVHRMRLEIDYDPNRAIQDNKAFRNPSIYEKLISFLNIDEKGSNFPKDIYDPYRWSPNSYYDELARVQNREIERLTQLAKEHKKTEPVAVAAVKSSGKPAPSSLTKASSQPQLHSLPGGSVATGYVEPRKKSKWDAGIPDKVGPNPPALDAPTNMASTIGNLMK